MKDVLRYGVLPAVILLALHDLLLDHLLLALGVLALVAGCLGFGHFRTQQRFRRLGFRVIRTGRDDFRYVELCNGQLRSLDLGGQMMAKGPHIVCLPREGAWQTAMPKWAHHRRQEIVQRVKAELGSANFTYEED